MGDRLGTRTDHAAFSTLSRELPEDVALQASAIVSTWRSAATMSSMNTAANVLTAAPEKEGDVEGFPGAGVGLEQNETVDGIINHGRQGWTLLQKSEAWKDAQFLQTLIDDGDVSTDAGSD
jgi:hypothetical protein